MESTTKIKLTIQDGVYKKAIIFPVEISVEKMVPILMLLGFVATIEVVQRENE